jgi:hypothetical protein
MTDIGFSVYDAFWTNLFNAANIDLDTATVKLTMHAAAYAPNLATDDFFNDATNELGTASGYTAGGITLANKVSGIVAANSWAKAHTVSTAWRLGEIVRPAAGNGFLYRCSVAGTGGGSAPSWPTVIGTTVADGGATWTCVGTKAYRFTSDPVVWSAPFDAGPFQRLVLWIDTGGAAATDPLIAVASYASAQIGQSGSWTITPDAGNGWLALPLP